MSKKRKWNDDYNRFGFACITEKDGTERPQCFICSVIFSNTNLKPSKLDEHFNRVHGGTEAGNDKETLNAKKARFDHQGTLPELGFVPTGKPLLEASYKIAYLVVKEKKPHTIAGELVKPCILEVAKIILGKDAERKVAQVPMSNDVIRNRIVDMSQDILEHVIDDIKASPVNIALQVDESTDVSHCSQLITLVRYVKNEEILEHILFCEPLKTTTKVQDVFNLVEEFFLKHGLDMNAIGSICTDGAPAMLGNRYGFAALLKRKVPEVRATHCLFHRHALAAITLPKSLQEVLSACVKIVNSIRGRSLNHRLFQAFCESIDSEHTVLLYHTVVRWLSRGRVLQRLFLEEKKVDFSSSFGSPEFVQKLAYLTDILTLLNELNISLQGSNINIVIAHKKLAFFKDKIPLWMRDTEKGHLARFPSLEEVVEEDELLLPDVATAIQAHLQQLLNAFDGYFSVGNLEAYDYWIRNPFLFQLSDMPDEEPLKEEIIDIQHDKAAEMVFEVKTLENYWASQIATFPSSSKKALGVRVPYATTYLCEAGFSTLLHIKTKFRNRLDAQHDMCLALSKKEPRISNIIEKKQEQNSH